MRAILGCVIVLCSALCHSSQAQYLVLERNARNEVTELIYQGEASWLVSNEKDPRLRNLPHLTAITLVNHRVTRDELIYVSSFSKLRHLVIGMAPEGVWVENNALQELSRLSNVEDVWLCVRELSSDDLAFLQSLRRLKSLTVELDGLCSPPSHARLNDHIGSVLEHCRELEHLEIAGMGRFTDRLGIHLSRIGRLESLCVSSRVFSDAFLRHLARSLQLRHLDVASDRFTDDGVRALAQMHSLRSLQVSSPLLTAASLEFVATLPALRVLDIAVPDATPQDVERIFGSRLITELRLPKVKMTDAHLRTLRGHASLQLLEFDGSLLTSESADMVRTMPAIRAVWVRNNKSLQDAVDRILAKKRRKNTPRPAAETRADTGEDDSTTSDVEKVIQLIQEMPNWPLKIGVPTQETLLRRDRDRAAIRDASRKIAMYSSDTIRAAMVELDVFPYHYGAKLFVLNKFLFRIPRSVRRDSREFRYFLNGFPGMPTDGKEASVRWPWAPDKNGEYHLVGDHPVVRMGPPYRPLEMFDFLKRTYGRRMIERKTSNSAEFSTKEEKTKPNTKDDAPCDGVEPGRR